MKFIDNLYSLSRFLSNFLAEEFHIVWMIFWVLFYRDIIDKWKNTVLDYKRGQNSEIISIFEILEVDYISILPLIFTSIPFGRIYSQKRIFLYCFMHKSWKTTKYIFWLQKVVKSWIWWHFQIRDQTFVCFSFFNFLGGSNFFLVGSHGFHGLFGAFCVAWVFEITKCKKK